MTSCASVPITIASSPSTSTIGSAEPQSGMRIGPVGSCTAVVGFMKISSSSSEGASVRAPDDEPG